MKHPLLDALSGDSEGKKSMFRKCVLQRKKTIQQMMDFYEMWITLFLCVVYSYDFTVTLKLFQNII